MRLRLDRYPSPIGDILIASDDAGALRAVDFEGYDDRMRRLLRRHYGDDYALDAGAAPRSIRRAFAAYFDGDLAALRPLPVRTGGTAFQRRVWSALREIEPGQTVSYGQLAVMIGRPGASRAVGMANGANPVAMVVPCHRVIGASGALTGFGGGLERKRWLLEHERLSRFSLQQSPTHDTPPAGH